MSLERIKSKCIEDGDCWIWRGGCAGKGNKHPQMSIGGQKLYVRRVLWEMKRRIPKGKGITTSCQVDRCVCPDHLIAMTLSEIARRAGAQGKFSTLTRRAKISASKRASHGKLTAEQAAAIRAGSEPMDKAAKTYGVCRSLIAKIRRGDRWREYGSPFAALMP